MFRVDVSELGGRTVLHVTGELDLATAPAFRQAALRAAADGAIALAVDLTGCDHLDSVGVGLLLGVLKRARSAGGDLVLVCDEPRVRRVLELTELVRIVPVVARLDELAVGAAAEPSTVPSGRSE